MKVISCLAVLGVLCTPAFAQGTKRDIDLVISHTVGEKKEINTLNTTTPIETRHKNVIAKYNPFSLTATGLMLFYQHIVSPQISASCIYTRSCSNFAKESIKEYGLVKGVFLAADRLLRCNRSCENDHPPSAFTENGKIVDEPQLYRRTK